VIADASERKPPVDYAKYNEAVRLCPFMKWVKLLAKVGGKVLTRVLRASTCILRVVIISVVTFAVSLTLSSCYGFGVVVALVGKGPFATGRGSRLDVYRGLSYASVFSELGVRSVISRYGYDDGDDDDTSRYGSVGIVSKLCWMAEQSWFDSR
jgi:hypothetical protein